MNRDALKFYLPGAVLVLFAFFLAYQFVEPAPPRSLRIATGGEGGAYEKMGEAYRRLFARLGIELEILHTGGSVENLAMLGDDRADIAFIQGGVRGTSAQGGVQGTAGEAVELHSLGAMFLEPLWFFTRDKRIGRLGDARGMRVSIGPAGSGTRRLMMTLMRDNGLGPDDAEFLDLPTSQAKDALLAGDIDAMALVASERSDSVRELLATDGIELFVSSRAAGYAQRYRFMKEVVLHEGAVDLAANLPDRSVTLLAVTAELVIRADVHPALVDLLMQIARRVHGGGGLLEAPGDYPTPSGTAFELDEQARKFYDRGPPFLQRYLPFWAATLVDRMSVMLIPLVTLLLPLARILPPALDWRVRSRVYRWYNDLRDIEARSELDPSRDELRALHARLDSVEEQVSEMQVPLTRTDMIYNLRQHIALIRRRLRLRR